jgi:hypothetical protein
VEIEGDLRVENAKLEDEINAVLEVDEPESLTEEYMSSLLNKKFKTFKINGVSERSPEL